MTLIEGVCIELIIIERMILPYGRGFRKQVYARLILQFKDLKIYA